jgi:DNA modification methylase
MSLPKTYYQEDGITLYCGDCMEILPQLEKVDLVLTDPPYGVNKADWDGKAYWEALMRMTAKGIEGVLTVDGTLIVFCATRFIKQTLNFFEIPYRWQFVWYAPNNMIPGDIGFAKYTAALIFSSAKSVYRNIQDVRISQAGTTELREIDHPTPKPLAIVQYLAEAYASEASTILDPFLGSGTTAVAAKRLGRKCIGIEISEKYCEIAVNRLRQMELFTAQKARDGE